MGKGERWLPSLLFVRQMPRNRNESQSDIAGVRRISKADSLFYYKIGYLAGESSNRASVELRILMKHEHIIKEVRPQSIAQEMGMEPGDVLLEINQQPIEDVFDFHYLSEDEYIEVLIRKANGEEWLLEIEKDEDEELGITFENSLMDEYKSCHNKCIFCFIDQMPKGMRETLYFKDDDSRLSFLQGNYVTLTNMKEEDIQRIIDYKLAPINISFHTTNPKLRCQMLNNRFAGEALKKVDMLYAAGTEMNGQIVLCKGVNDGLELERTIADLTKYLPHLKSVSIVPVGLTKYREGLYPLEPFQKEDALQVISLVHQWQEKLYQEYGLHFIHASDEWYILAGLPFPKEETYDGYLQIENGVGMMRSLIDEFEEEMQHLESMTIQREVSAATGKLAYPVIGQMAKALEERCQGLKIHVYEIHNDFFGERITVAGLLTGQDLIAQLKDQPLGEKLVLTSNMLRSEGDCFLDDVTVDELEKALQVKVEIVKSEGRSLINGMVGLERKESINRKI